MPLMVTVYGRQAARASNLTIAPAVLPRWDAGGVAWFSALGAYASDWRGIPDTRLPIAPPFYYILSGQQPNVDRTVLAAARAEAARRGGTMTRIKPGTPLLKMGA